MIVFKNFLQFLVVFANDQYRMDFRIFEKIAKFAWRNVGTAEESGDGATYCIAHIGGIFFFCLTIKARFAVNLDELTKFGRANRRTRKVLDELVVERAVVGHVEVAQQHEGARRPVAAADVGLAGIDRKSQPFPRISGCRVSQK